VAFGAMLGFMGVIWLAGEVIADGFSLDLAPELVIGLVGWFAVGFAAGAMIGVAVWADSLTRYYVAVATMAVRGRGPLRFAVFLDWAADAGILRVSGIAYQFRHQQLQARLTTADVGTDLAAGCSGDAHPEARRPGRRQAGA
jgi:hypothetical protein